MNNNIIKQQIINKFRELCYTLGIRRITVDMLARECGISKKTIYKYFKNKDEIVESSTIEIYDLMATHIRKISSSDRNPLEKLYLLFDISFEIFGKISHTLLYDIQTFYPEIQSKIDNLLEEHSHLMVKTFNDGIEMGIFNNLNPSFIAGFIMGAVNTVFKAEFMLKNNLTVEESISTFKKIILTGLLKESDPS